MPEYYCGGSRHKRRYRSRKLARRHMNRLISTGDPLAKGLSVYRCPTCRGFHVGHRPEGRTSG